MTVCRVGLWPVRRRDGIGMCEVGQGPPYKLFSLWRIDSRHTTDPANWYTLPGGLD
jgi:hypothetical protein